MPLGFATASGVPAVLAGIVVTHLGLQSTFEIFGSVVSAVALIVGVEDWRTRPVPKRAFTAVG